MDLALATTLARRLMLEHGLTDWTFRFDRARRRFGLCDYGNRTISLSKHLTELNDAAQVRDTLLHEIAHALSPGAGHGPRWRELCSRLGAKPVRLFADEVARPVSKYLLICPRCRQTLPRERRTRRVLACKPCCDAHNGGRYSARYGLVWQRLG
ncbi:MAG: SprT-like domain-containing protein [Deinococcota bacterium]|nr:SprT-like domain-containing protein [Deinococcota bacterium]